jgi:F-type H+-transporting ATPase subunit b
MVDVLPNYSVFIQIVNFLVLLIVLNFVVLKPIRGILKQRQEKIAGLSGDITTSTEGVKSKESELDALRLEANKQGAEAREELKSKGQAEERKLIDAATAEMEESVAKVRAQVSEEIGQARDELKGQVQAFGVELAQKILGRSIQ